VGCGRFGAARPGPNVEASRLPAVLAENVQRFGRETGWRQL